MCIVTQFQTGGKISSECLPEKKEIQNGFPDVSITYPSHTPIDCDCGVEMGRRALIYYLRLKKELKSEPSIHLVLPHTHLHSAPIFLSLLQTQHTHTHTHIGSTQVMALPPKKIELCVPSNYLSGVSNGPNNIFTLLLPINF